ncbi:hypothetical protein ACROYT_G012297 [Oculina patagonica]
MTEGIADCMPLALRSVGDAIRLDSQNRTKEAYCQYLSCIIYISQVLKDDAWDKDLRLVYNSDTAKLYRLLQQCQERALTIISSFEKGTSTNQNSETQVTQHLQPPSEGVPRRYSDSSVSNADQSVQSHLPPESGAARKLSDTTAPRSTLTTPPTDGQLHLPSPPASPMLHHRRTDSYDPLDKAYKENKQLIQAYRTRMQNSNKGRRNQDVMSRNLSLMRRMSENLVIAQAREQAIKKKLQERQQRLQEETNRRFGPAVFSTKEQQDQRVLYTKILEFEQETVWPKLLREKLKLMPVDSKLVKEIITKIFSSADHPLTQFLLQYQYHVYRKLAPLVKDVGFPDVKSGRKATSKGAEIILNESHSDEQAVEAKSDANGEGEGKDEQNTNSLKNVEGNLERLPSESDNEESVDNGKDVVGDNDEEKGHDDVEHLEVTSEDDIKSGDVEKGTNVDNECASPGTDLEKLKNLLEEDAQPETSKTDTTQVDDSVHGQEPSAVAVVDESENLESYFEELEDDMFGWESDEVDNNGTDKESTDVDSCREITDKNALGEESDANIKEGGTEVVEESTDANDEALSSQLESVGDDDTHSTSLDNMQSPSENDASTNENVESQNIITNDQDSLSQPRDDVNPLEANERISSLGEQHTDEQTTSNNTDDEGETQQRVDNSATCETPSEQTSDQASSGDQGNAQIPKLSLFASEEGSNIKEQDGGIPAPATDEVRKQLKDVLVDVRFFLENLQKLLILAYEQLDTPAGRDLCYSCMEFPFFKPLWPMLLAVLRQVNHEKELCLADVMSDNISKDPAELGVPQRLCMEDQSILDATGNKYPYQMAVEELHKVVTLFCPLEKLECLVRTSRCICQCVEDYWENKGKPRHSPETAIGCDDLLPILSFVIIRSGMAQLVSECDAMEEFIPEGYLMGEEGYCLTTLLTALAYLATLKPT